MDGHHSLFTTHQFHLHMMVVSVVNERHTFLRLFVAVHDNAFHDRSAVADGKGDMVEGLAIAVVDLER
jgi:hypothetical protein